jgi:membrane protease subunit HflK
MATKLLSLLFRNDNQGPPDLDQLFSNAIKKMSGSKKNKSEDSFSFNFKIIFALVFCVWALSGIYIVRPAEQAVELRFGKYFANKGPGPHWVPKIIGSKNIINVEKIYTFSHKAQMLTKDENIVDVSLSVQYRIKDPKNFLFNVKSPEYSLVQATASAVRQIVGHTSLDNILTDGRSKAREQIVDLVKNTLQIYNTGIEITDLNLQPIKPPEEVTSAFDDAIMAREDEQRYINKALAYKEKVVLISQGKAERYLKEADAESQKLILDAKANTAGYLALLPEHIKSPDLTDFRLYTDSLERIFAKTRKIILEGDSKAQVMIWPDKNEMKELAPFIAPSIIDNKNKEVSVTQKEALSYHGRQSYSDHKLN